MKRLQTAMSLVELLIAVALGLWLLSGVIICYLSSQRAYQMNEALARMQENGRLALHALSRDIRSAGYIGCLPIGSIQLNQLDDTYFTPATRIAAWQQLQSTSPFHLPTEIARNAVKNTDILLVQSLGPDDVELRTVQAKLIKFNKKSAYKVGDILIIADCHHSNMIAVTAVKGDSINVLPALTQNYNPVSSEIGHLTSIFYYIRKTTRRNTVGAPIYALYRRDINAPATTAQELVEGVENIQLRFGVKQAGTIQYLTIQQLKEQDWQHIVSVQIALLLNSIEPVTSGAKAFTFNQHVYPATDKLLRQQWDTTIALREPIVAIH